MFMGNQESKPISCVKQIRIGGNRVGLIGLIELNVSSDTRRCK